jgi:hypothetical protein
MGLQALREERQDDEPSSLCGLPSKCRRICTASGRTILHGLAVYVSIMGGTGIESWALHMAQKCYTAELIPELKSTFYLDYNELKTHERNALGMVVHGYNPSPMEAEAGGSQLEVQL